MQIVLAHSKGKEGKEMVMHGRQLHGMLGLFVLLWFLLSACAPAAVTPGGTRPGAAPAAQPAKKEPRQGGTFHVSSTNTPANLSYYKDAGTGGDQTHVHVFDLLVSYDYKLGEDYRKEFNVVPRLAERWEQPNDTTYVFHLRKGVKWHDGEDFTADDVVFSYNYLRDPKNAFPRAGNVRAADKIEALDRYTVRMTTKEPLAPFLENIADRYIVILPKHIYDRGLSFEKLEGEIGTGPYRMISFDPTSKAVYERFDGYWETGKPYIDKIVIFYNLDWSARIAAFIAKNVDVLTVSDRPQFETAKIGIKDLQSEAFVGGNGVSMYMRVDKPPFSDVRVRRAMHLALDRQRMVETLTQGNGAINPPATVAFSAWAIPQEELLKLPGYRQPKDQDIAEAKRLLTEAGYPNGFKTSIQAVVTYSTNPKIAEMASEQLKRVGIDVTLNLIEWGAYNKNLTDGTFDIVMEGMQSDRVDGSLMKYYHSQSSANTARIKDPRLDELVEKQRSTMNRQERYKTILDLQRLLQEELYTIPTIEFGMYAMWHPYVHDYVYQRGTTTMLFRAADIWLDENAPKR